MAAGLPWNLWNEESGFTAEDFRGALLQLVDGGIFAVDIVAHFCCGHGLAWRAWDESPYRCEDRRRYR